MRPSSQSRTTRYSGETKRGVFILSKNDVTITREEVLGIACEILWCKAEVHGSRNLHIGAYYRPHERDMENGQLYTTAQTINQLAPCCVMALVMVKISPQLRLTSDSLWVGGGGRGFWTGLEASRNENPQDLSSGSVTSMAVLPAWILYVGAPVPLNIELTKFDRIQILLEIHIAVLSRIVGLS